MGPSVLEQIAQHVLATIANVTTENGYPYGLNTVIRASGGATSPAPFLAVIFQLPGSVSEGPQTTEQWTQLFAVVVYVNPEENDSTPVDTYANELAAAIHTEVMRDYTRGGLAIDTRVLPTITFPEVEGEFAGFTFQFEVVYRTAIDKPFVGAGN